MATRGKATVRSGPLIPDRDWKLGQTDWLTAGLMWGAAAAVFWGFVVAAAIAAPLVGGGAQRGLVFALGGLLLLLVGSAACVAFLRMFTLSRQASFGRLSSRLKLRFPWARVRVREPWMRVAGMNVFTGRRGVVTLAPDRAILIVQRVPPWAVGVGLAIGCCGLPSTIVPESEYISALVVFGCLLLSFFTGADVHEILYEDIDHVDAGEARVQWSQRGPDAPRVVRFRVLNPTDPGAASIWLAPADETDPDAG